MKLFGLEISWAKKRSVSNPSDEILMTWSGGSLTASGAEVTEKNALGIAAVYACVRVISENIATLPLHLNQINGRSKNKAVKHPLYSMLRYSPNPEITSVEFIEAMQGHLTLRGNCYAEKVHDGAGVLRQLWPIAPTRVTPKRLPDKTLVYDVSLPSGQSLIMDSSRIFHLRGMGSNGIVGYSPLQYSAEVFGISMTAQEYGARFFSNDASPGGVLEHPGQLSETARDNLKKYMEDRHKGLDKKHRMGILEEGMKWVSVGISPEDAQMLETRRFEVEEIARIFNVPPHMIKDLTRATFSNIEHQSLEFVVYTLRPWLVRWESGIQARLLDERDRDIYFARFSVEGLLRGDTKSRYESYNIAHNAGWMSVNDIRELEDMNPLAPELGDVYLTPLNMIPTQALEKYLLSQKASVPTRGMLPVFLADVDSRVRRRVAADMIRFIEKGKAANGEIEKHFNEYWDGDDFKRFVSMTSYAFAEASRITDCEREFSDRLRNSLDNLKIILHSVFNGDRDAMINALEKIKEGNGNAASIPTTIPV